MQDRYSIQQFDTKKAALDALEDPSFVPAEAACRPAPELPAPADVTLPAIQAEIDRLKAEIARLADRQFDLAMQERSSAPPAPVAPHSSRKRTRKSVGGAPREEVFYRRSAANLITFPNPQSA
jgi:hypothetical protein